MTSSLKTSPKRCKEKRGKVSLAATLSGITISIIQRLAASRALPSRASRPVLQYHGRKHYCQQHKRQHHQQHQRHQNQHGQYWHWHRQHRWHRYKRQHGQHHQHVFFVQLLYGLCHQPLVLLAPKLVRLVCHYVIQINQLFL